MTSSRRFRCEAKSVRAARHFVREVLREQPSETVEAAELMTSELATNAVRHAHSDFELTIHCSQRDIRIEVSDSGPGQPTLRSPTPQERSGRGLRIVQELSDTWGTVPSTNGKMVWFTLLTQTFAMEREARPASCGDEVSGPSVTSLRPDKPPRGVSGHPPRRSTPRANRHRSSRRLRRGAGTPDTRQTAQVPRTACTPTASGRSAPSQSACAAGRASRRTGL